MTYVVTESCIKCKYTDCVDVCPVDCIEVNPEFVETPDQLSLKYRGLMAAKAG